MNLHQFLISLTAEAREALAKKCGTSVDYLFQLAYGKRTPKVALVVAIERESGGVVRCERLLPEVDWAYLRRRKAVETASVPG